MQTMEYLTTCVKWCGVPEAHGNFDWSDNKLLNWFITRYVCDSQHLTLICVKALSANVSQVSTHSTDTMKRLWSTSTVDEMKLGSFTNVAMTVDRTGKHGVTEFCTTHTPVSFMTSFYEYVQGIMGLIKRSGWTRLPELTMSDNDTSFRMLCEHEPHSVFVETEEAGPSKLLRVHCNQPQTIYELLFKHGLVCSSVWSAKIHLSARAPCCALAYHHLTVIKFHAIPPKSEFNNFPKFQVPHHKMKFAKIRTQLNVMRYQPYHVPLLGPARKSLWQDEFFSTNEKNMIPVAIYYHNSESTLAEIVKADGRFLDTVGCFEVVDSPRCPTRIVSQQLSLDSGLGYTPAKQLDYVKIVLFGQGDQKDQDSEDDSLTEDSPYSCPSCKGLADVYIIGCGHLCCRSCLNASIGTESEDKCGVCRGVITSTAPIYLTSVSDEKCPKCEDTKTWVTQCGHIICPCERVICRKCGYHPLTEIRRLFITS